MQRYLKAILSLFGAVFFIWIFNTQWRIGKTDTPRLGYFLSPQYGFWQNAEPIEMDRNENLQIKGLKDSAMVYIDSLLIPHIEAKNDPDAYFIQGYLHAKNRLWQMEFQTYVVGGRLSEILGKEHLDKDLYFRRLGLTYAAENSLALVEKDTVTKTILDAYTAGVNAYIENLRSEKMPFEYKLLNYKPEKWTNLKSALFLKLMAWDLSGTHNDLLYTNAKNYFSYPVYELLFPNQQPYLDPIIPRGTAFNPPAVLPTIPDSLFQNYIHSDLSFQNISSIQPNPNNGSNNWVMGGSKTASGRPILANDPHLGLNLPSLWYQMQITTPTMNVYGVSFPGSPTIVIGFNDSCAWGVTNAGRDVKDYFEIKFKDSTQKEYLWNNAWVKTNFRKEIIKIKGGEIVEINLPMSPFGPVMYDKNYPALPHKDKSFAVQWTAHQPSNELKVFYNLNKMKNQEDFKTALDGFKCPGQNFVYADTKGNIGIIEQGKFPAKWRHQGDFVMPGWDSSYAWQGYIDNAENPQIWNPERGFVSSANQEATDNTYPYYLGRTSNFPPFRGLGINQKLAAMNGVTPRDMMQLQTNNDNIFATIALPILLSYIDTNRLSITEKKYYYQLYAWNRINDINETGPTIFDVWLDSTEQAFWGDEYKKAKIPMAWPDESTLIYALAKDTANYPFADDINTPNKIETNQERVMLAFKRASKTLDSLLEKDGLAWGAYKKTAVTHLLKIPALSKQNLPIGGGHHVINATTSTHGPSWRMIVHLTDSIEAYGIYPGGQSGNPGSPYYTNFINDWTFGNYQPILFLKPNATNKKTKTKWQIQYTPK